MTVVVMTSVNLNTKPLASSHVFKHADMLVSMDVQDIAELAVMEVVLVVV